MLERLIHSITGVDMSMFEGMTSEEIEARDNEIERIESQHEAKAKQERYERSGVPRRYWQESLETYRITTAEQRKAAEAVANFIGEIRKGKRRILVILGSVGTGKTHLLCAAIRELGGKYKTAAELIEEIRHAKSFNADMTEKEIMESHARGNLSVMDEIGRGINPADEKYMLYEYANSIYNMRASALWASNFTKKEFLQYVGAAVADRLVEYGSIIEIGGESYRKELRRSSGRE